METWRAEVYGKIAICAQVVKDLSTAIKLDLKLETYAKMFALGRCHQNLENHIKAIDSFNKTIEMDPQNEEAYLYRGLSYHLLSKKQHALNDVNKAIELNPLSATACFIRRRIHDNYEAKIRDYKIAARLGNQNF